VFIWDIETFPDGIDRWSKAYAVGLIPLDSVQSILGNKLNSDNPIDDETLTLLRNETKIFGGPDLQPITDMIEYLGGLQLENVTLIAHKGKDFDNWVFLSESDTVPYQTLKTGSGLVDMKVKNPHTCKEIQQIMKKKFMEKKKVNNPSGGNFLQTLTFRCSYNHIKSSLDRLCESYKLPSNLCKTGLNHEGITRDNFMDKQDEWRPYLELDVISLACCVTKFNEMAMELVGQNMQSCISSPQLTLKGWYAKLGPDQPIFSFTNKYIRHFIRKTIKGGRVVATIKKFTSPLTKQIEQILHKYLGGDDQENFLDLIDRYRVELVKPTKKIVKKETDMLKDLKVKHPSIVDIVKWCDKNTNHPVFQSDIPQKFFQLREELFGRKVRHKTNDQK
jgi:hypothetical protein